MIKLVSTGSYMLIETKHHTKILYLDDDVYAWVEPSNIGEMLVASHAIHKSDCVLSIGEYRIYEVTDEPKLTDLSHLELEVGKNTWQGYLLLSGLPDDIKKRVRIVPTSELVSKSSTTLDKAKKLERITS